MSTTITWGGTQGAQSATFDHPRELPMKIRHPAPPRQPITSWAATLAHFEVLMNASDFAGAVKYVASEYVYVTESDVPAGALAAFKAWVQSLGWGKAWLEGFVPPASGSWRTDGARI